MVRDTPPARLAAMYAARIREQAARDLDRAETLLMVGDGDWGHETRWRGKGSAPKSDWDTSQAPLVEWLDRKRRLAAGLPPKTREELAREDARAWREQLSRMKAMQA